MSDYYAPYTKLLDTWTPPTDGWLSMLRDYLLYMPYPNGTQDNDNRNPRVRLLKYLYYDTPKPLDNALPTVQQRLEICYNPAEPDKPPTDKGYRFYSQGFASQAQLDGQTIIRMLVGRVVPTGVFKTETAVTFEILSNVTYEANSKTAALSRTYEIENAIIEALNGVNMLGVGTWYFDRRQHGDCGSYAIGDDTHNVGRRLTMAFTSMGGSN